LWFGQGGQHQAAPPGFLADGAETLACPHQRLRIATNPGRDQVLVLIQVKLAVDAKYFHEPYSQGKFTM